MKILIFKLFVLAGCVALCACGGDNAEKSAGELLDEATAQFEGGKYEEALVTIDSLRKTYPQAIEARKKALALYQDIELTRAQKNLEQVDGELAVAKNEYEKMNAQAEASKMQGTATAEQLTAVTRMRIKRDSLQTRFDMQCVKIKYIHKKQKE